MDGGTGGQHDAAALQPAGGAAAQPPEEDAARMQPEDAALPHVEDAAAPVADDAGYTELDDAGVTLPDDDAGEPQSPDGGSERECGTGVPLADACWYLGARGASCMQVCAEHGGYIARASYVGVAAEGGALARCDMLLDLLFAPGETMAGRRDDENPLGCHLYEDAAWWLATGPAFDPLAAESHARIVCSCNGP